MNGPDSQLRGREWAENHPWLNATIFAAAIALGIVVFGAALGRPASFYVPMGAGVGTVTFVWVAIASRPPPARGKSR